MSQLSDHNNLLITTTCPLCGKQTGDTLLYQQNFNFSDLNDEIFSARRLPDKLHARIVRCNSCGVYRSNPRPKESVLRQLYKLSKFTYDDQIPWLTKSYLAALKELIQNQEGLKILEIGCGNGFLLDALEKKGHLVTGIEPSEEAIQKAPEKIKEKIINGMFSKALFAKQQFSIIMAFQVFDHVDDPNQVLEDAYALLEEGGYLVLFNHDTSALSARILGESSPIIDIEHTYLYNRKNLSQLIQHHRFEVVTAAKIKNYYPLSYLVRLLPLPKSIKTSVYNALSGSFVDQIGLRLPLGNQLVIGKKLSMKTASERNITSFNTDVVDNGGYRYTTNASVSSQMANQRLTDVTLEYLSLENKKVIDIGCGDGAYTARLAIKSKPKLLVGIDPAAEAIEQATAAYQANNLEFSVQSAYQLPYKDQAFDIAIIRGVIHHLDKPQEAIVEAFRAAREVLIIDPNGYNPILKVIEKASPYHQKHDEQSYPASKIDSWIEHAGGYVLKRGWYGLVPFFCPAFLAHAFKFIEPFCESFPLVNKLSCAVYVVWAKKTN